MSKRTRHRSMHATKNATRFDCAPRFHAKDKVVSSVSYSFRHDHRHLLKNRHKWFVFIPGYTASEQTRLQRSLRTLILLYSIECGQHLLVFSALAMADTPFSNLSRLVSPYRQDVTSHMTSYVTYKRAWG